MNKKINSIHTFVISLPRESLRRKAILKKLNDVPGTFEFLMQLMVKK